MVWHIEALPLHQTKTENTMKNLDSAILSDLFSTENTFTALNDLINDLGLELVSVSIDE